MPRRSNSPNESQRQMTTELLEAELGPDVLAIAAEPWRLEPSPFAAEVELQCAGGAFRRTSLADYLSVVIADAVMRTGARLIVNIAPRQGKSEQASFATPTWFLEHFPQKRVILGTHTASLSLEYGRRIRNEFDRNPRLTTHLQEDAQAANQWNTEDGGGMKAVGVGGAVLGFGADLAIIDDPHKGWVEAQSPTERRKVIEWFEGTLLGRLEPDASVIVVMQRLHKDDLTGHLIKNSKEPWKVIKLPALARANDPMGRAVGAPVCPERFNLEQMLAKQAVTPRRMWASMFDQDPDEAKEGRTYGNYSIENVKGEPETALDTTSPVFVTFDFNVNPGMHAEIGQADTRADVIKFRHEVHGDRMKTPECAKAVAKILAPDGVFRFPKLIIYGDRSGKTENTQTANTDYSLIGRMLRENGVSNFEFQVPAANPPIKARVAAMNDSLCDGAGVRHLLVHSDCKRLIADLENVEDGDDGLPDKSDSGLTHPSDAAGYAVNRIRPIIQLKTTGGNTYAPPPRAR